MPRNDSALITGMSSATSRKLEAKRAEEKQAKAEQGAKLRPHAEIVLEECKQAREEISHELGNLIHVDMTGTQVKQIVLALRLADSKIVSLQKRLINKLKADQKT